MSRPIVSVPNTVLTSPSEKVTAFDKKLLDLIRDMKETLDATVKPKGVGLAAPQIGVGLQIFITKPTSTSDTRVFINPTIIERSSDQTDGVPERGNKLEGCLSIPEVWGKVRRTTSLTLQYQDQQGETLTEKFSGFMATIIQHETDHVNGILFTQRVLEQKGKLYQVDTDQDGKEELVEIKI